MIRALKAFLFGALLGFICSLILTAFAILLDMREAKAEIIKLDSLYVDYRNFAMVNDKNRNLLTYPEPAKEGLNLGLTTDVLGIFYWDSEVQSITTDAQYRSVALDMRFGLKVTDHLQIGYYHKSQHLLDRPSYNMPKFPVEDAIQIKFFIFKSRQPRESLF
jgi:hypothetical protein